VDWYSGQVPTTVWTGEVGGQRCYFIDPHSEEGFFRRPSLYGAPDDVARFAFFSRAAMEFLLKTNRRPDVIHCHDWQTALVPVLLFEIYQRHGMPHQRVCLTVHNFSQQGLTGAWVLEATGLGRPEYFCHPDRLRDDHHPEAVNLLKGGIVYSNYVTTVSPHHAWEPCHTDQGRGLGPTLHLHRDKYRGVLNGVDYDVWNPEIDRLIPYRFGPADLDGKYANKQALRQRFLLRDGYKPVVSYLGRIDRQKGVHLIQHALRYSLGECAQFVVLGTSTEPEIHEQFQRLKAELNDHPDCHLELSFTAELGHLVYAGSDLIVVPSMFEPCGLVQLTALKYGTVPVVRHIGGLVDTVHDRDYSDRPGEARNGYAFHQVDPTAVESALSRALRLWFDHPKDFRRLMMQGMRQDHSWAVPGETYLQIYEYIRHR
jgi:starch synthase